MKPIIIVIFALLTATAGFFGGMKYQESKTPSFAGRMGANQFGPGQGLNRGVGGNGNGQNRAGFRPVSGIISSVDDQTLTVKSDDGSSKIIILSAKTEINKAETGSPADLSSGIQVAVFGTENSDGSITAQNIQLNPKMFTISPTPNP